MAIESSTNRPMRQHQADAAEPGADAGQGLALPADVGDDEHVEHHHRAGVDDDLRGGDELGLEQQEQQRQAEQVADQRQHRVEGVAQRDDPDGADDGADRRDEEEDVLHGAPGGYSPSERSGVRSSGSASSISLVKIRSLRLRSESS